MNIEDAIQHCYGRAKADCSECAREHLQLAEWLIELKKYKDIEKQGKFLKEWIPCDEQLPEESLNSVIGWDAYRERCCFVQYWGGRWVFGNDVDSVNIVAWMPVPEPYDSAKLEDNEELKQCPFCGGKAKMLEVKGFRKEIVSASVVCEKCGVSTNNYKTKKVAVKSWNQRLGGFSG